MDDILNAGPTRFEDVPIEDWINHPPGVEAAPMDDEAVDSESVAWLQAVFRLTRSDGSVVFGPRGRSRSRSRLLALERAVRRVGDPHLARVMSWWRPASSLNDEENWAAPPLPTMAWTDRALAVLRPDWTPRGECVAIDHRAPGSITGIEVAGRGVTWLGPTWTSPSLTEPFAPALPTSWTTGAYADAFEWSFQAGPVAVTRTAVLIRGGALAVLLQSESGVESGVGEVRWALPDGVEARPDPASRALILAGGRGKPSARVLPIGLPAVNYTTDRGALTVEGREVVLRQRTEGANRCLAILVSWRQRPPRNWRALTVAEDSKVCPPSTAFAARVGWGFGQTGLLIYRSLGPSGMRSVLGHQTKARFLVGAYDPTGTVHPWIKVMPPKPGEA